MYTMAGKTITLLKHKGKSLGSVRLLHGNLLKGYVCPYTVPFIVTHNFQGLCSFAAMKNRYEIALCFYNKLGWASLFLSCMVYAGYHAC